MNKYETEALNDACNFASEAETILEVSGVLAELKTIEHGNSRLGDVASRSFDVVDGATVAGLLINLFMWIGQVRRGHILKGASRNEIIQDLSIRMLDNDKISGAAKERLLSKALDSLSKEDES